VKPDPLGQLAVSFALLSLVAIGGANAVIPALHELAVSRSGWLTDREFATDFALANAAPGPNVLIVTLIGFKVAGLAGATVATLAMCGPSSLLCFVVSGAWERFRISPWRKLAERALAPVTIGLITASAYTLTAASAAGNPLHVAITAGASAAALWSRINPLWLLAAAAAAGFLGIG
jgi:chromate transporter